MPGGESRELRRLETFERDQGREEVRWSFDEFEPENGRATKYVSARKWFKGTDGEWHPTKSGVTIRLAELDRVVEALQRVQRARDGKERQASNKAARSEQRRPAQHRERTVDTTATDAELEQDGRLF